MQVSLETLSGLERKMTIEVPADQVESQVQSRLQEAAKTVSLKGFRKGKVPLKVIKNRYGAGVRQEVAGELMSQSYYQAVSQEKVRPAGQPRIEAEPLEEGKSLKFTATFEVYPDLELADFSKISLQKRTAEITDADVDKIIENLRQQRQTFNEVDRPAQQQDQLDIDFTGTIDGEEFEGGSAQGTSLVLGSGRMIPGFEDGLVGASSNDDKELVLTFPKDYQSQEMAGKEATFKVHVNAVKEPVIPELNDDFFASFDVKEGGEDAFRNEVRNNMERELKNAVRNQVKTQVIEGLLENHEIDTPKALVDSEIENLRAQTMQQFGGGANIDQSMLPAELFQQEAEKRVATGLIMGEIIRQKELKADQDKVRSLLEDMAASYENPDEVVQWYYSNQEQLAQVESMALEEAVIDMVVENAKVKELKSSYEEALQPPAAKTEEAEEKAEKKAKPKKKKAAAKKKSTKNANKDSSESA